MKKKITFFNFILLFSCVFSIGCEGYNCAEGVVIDALSKEPLDSVFCNVITGSEEIYTDSSGIYDVCNNFGGCVPDCADIVVEFSKVGYKTIQLENPGTDSIYLERR